MCGRYVTPEVDDDLLERFDVDEVDGEPPAATFNARPSFGVDDPRPPVPVVIESARDGIRRLASARWPFTPSWSKEPWLKVPTFNATSEGIAGKAMWRDAVRKHRALLPATGYFETHGAGKRRQRWYFHAGDDAALALGGIYSWWRADANAPWLLTVAIITIPAPEPASRIHDRAPLVLPREWWDTWLDPTAAADQGFVDAAAAAAVPLVAGLAHHEVAWLDADGPEMIERSA